MNTTASRLLERQATIEQDNPVMSHDDEKNYNIPDDYENYSQIKDN